MVTKILHPTRRQLLAEKHKLIHTQIGKLHKELRADYEEENKRRNEKTAARTKIAQGRLDALNKRLKAIGLDDLFATGCQVNVWDQDGGHPHVWVCIDGGRSRDSETIALALLDRLEKIVGKKRR